jgi:hypothetical protein
VHPLLGTLSIVDVGARREPADDATVGIAQRRAAAEDPPILSICRRRRNSTSPLIPSASPRMVACTVCRSSGWTISDQTSGCPTVSSRLRPVNSRAARFAYARPPCASPTTRSSGRKSTIVRSSRSSCRTRSSASRRSWTSMPMPIQRTIRPSASRIGTPRPRCQRYCPSARRSAPRLPLDARCEGCLPQSHVTGPGVAGVRLHPNRIASLSARVSPV